MSGLGYLGTLMDALVGLENTISQDLHVTRWRPLSVDPPHLYNWLVPSPADIPAVGIARDTLELSIRIVVPSSDIDEQTAMLETYYDLARDVIDSDVIRPRESVLKTAAHKAERVRSRNILDTFNDIEYLGLELVLQVELRRTFSP